MDVDFESRQQHRNGAEFRRFSQLGEEAAAFSSYSRLFIFVYENDSGLRQTQNILLLE